jgi:hypothetical protein
MADSIPPSSADVTESGSLNLPEPSGPHRPVMGLFYLFLLLLLVDNVWQLVLLNRIITVCAHRQAGHKRQERRTEHHRPDRRRDVTGRKEVDQQSVSSVH